MTVSSAVSRALPLTLAFGATSVTLSNQTFAVEPGFRLSVTAARAGMTMSNVKPDGGAETKVKTTTLQTFPNLTSLELAIFPEGYAVYLYPAATGGALWLGKTMGDAMEVGVTLGLNNTSIDKPTKDESNENTIGAYYWGSMPAGPGALEVNINPFLAMAKGTSEAQIKDATGKVTSTMESEANGTNFGAYADALFVMPWGKNFDYAAGLDLTFTTGDSKVKPKGGTESKSKATSAC